MTQELVSFKGQQVAESFRGVIDPKESLSDGIGGGYGIIGYKGKEWTLRYRGEEYRFLDESKKHPSPYIDVIIIRQAPGKSKSYYPSYEEGDRGRPVCASIDSITPDEDVEQKQSETCAVCKRNEFKTNEKGIRSKECADYKRLAVLLLPDVTEAMLGSPLLEPVFLRVPAASLTNLGTYGQYLQKQNYPFIGLVTRVSFEAGKAYPKLQFFGQALLPEENAPVVLPIRDEPLTLRITGEEGTYRVKQIGQKAAPAQIEQKPAVSTVSFVKAAADKQNGGTKAAPTQIEQKPVVPAVGMEVALEAVETARVAVTKMEVAEAAAADGTGDTEESDADLDARLGSLIKF